MKQLIENKILKKPKFEKTKYPMDIYKPFINPTNPCENTIKFKTKKSEVEWEQILQLIKGRKKEKNKIHFNHQYND